MPNGHVARRRRPMACISGVAVTTAAIACSASTDRPSASRQYARYCSIVRRSSGAWSPGCSWFSNARASSYSAAAYKSRAAASESAACVGIEMSAAIMRAIAASNQRFMASSCQRSAVLDSSTSPIRSRAVLQIPDAGTPRRAILRERRNCRSAFRRSCCRPSRPPPTATR